MFPEALETLSDWLGQLIDRLAKLKHPLIYGMLTNPGWLDKNELLVSFKPPAAIADQLAEFSALLGSAVPGSMTFLESVIHSTIAVIRIPEKLRDVITLNELSDIACAAVTSATTRWLAAHPDPLMTRYTGLKADQKAIFAWPEKTGLLYDLRTTILAELQDAIWGTPGLSEIEINGSWAEHMTLLRFMKEYGSFMFRILQDLRAAMEEWEPTPPFAMAAVELSYVTIEDSELCLDSIVAIDLPEPQS